MQLPSGLRLSVESDPAWEDREFVDKAIGHYNDRFVDESSYAYFGIFVREGSGAIRAGLIAQVYVGWLFVNLLWVDGELRRGGIGRGLIAAAERRAVELGCHSAWLDTFSFQAPEFYKKLGYSEFARLDYPPGHERIFLRKRIAPE
jgi:GNAT superfamily N-acetyltransferase